MIDCVAVSIFSEDFRKRLSSYFFGNEMYSWIDITQHYRSLEAVLKAPGYDWVRGPASDTLAYLDHEDEKVLKAWIAENPHPL